MTPAAPNTAAQIQAALERRILHGLACEWDNALAVLPPAQTAGLRKPLFGLSDTRTRFGTWSGVRREIRISRRLAFEHSWEAVRAVLRHEMAHQYAEQVLGVAPSDEAPHGPAFQRACAVLRADPAASGRFPPLAGRPPEAAHTAADRILERVQKLMALADSRNRHEAEAAMAKAHELIARYNVDLCAHRPERRFVSAFAGRPALRHNRDAYHLAHLLQAFYFIEGLWIPAYVVAKGRMGRVLEISGTRENVDIALYVHACVRRYIDTEWGGYNPDRRLNHYRRIDFAVGVIEGFQAKLKERLQADDGPTAALVKSGDPLLKGYMTQRHPYTRRFSRAGAQQDADVLRDGMRSGRRLVIARGIEEKGGPGGGLLPPPR